MMESSAQLFTMYENFNKLLVGLYNDDVPLHTRVRNFLYLFTDVVYYDRCSIVFYTKTSDGRYKKHSSISLNWEDKSDSIKRYNEYFCYLDDTYPVLDRSYPLVFKSTDFFNTEKRSQTEYWQDYLLPNDCIYSIDGNINLNSSKGLLGLFVFYRSGSRSDFNDNELMLAKMLQPHLSNVFKNYMEFDQSNEIPFMMENYNCAGICLIDENLNIVRSNNKFKTIESENSGIISRKIISLCCIECSFLSKPGWIISRKIISLCCNLTADKSGRDKLCDEYKFDDTPIFLEVSKLPASRTDSNHSSNIKYSGIVYDLSYFFQQTLIQAKEKYYLTPREFDIIKEVLKGKKNEDIASELYISVPSVKKYLASIYSKMEIKTQKQIFEKLKLI